MSTTTVTWVLDSDSKFEISSKDHLIQLTNSGTLYANAGSTPSDFMASDYVQTADIDLLSDSTNIKPIGLAASIFSGKYDGNNYTISNWSYIDPNFETFEACEVKVGLFGDTSVAELKSIRLTGVWLLQGYSEMAGMLAANLMYPNISNIECDFSPGSKVIQGSTTATMNQYTGGLLGHVVYGTLTGITLKGDLDIVRSASANTTLGGVIGRTNVCTLKLVRNLATFADGLDGFYVGGIVGYQISSQFEKGLNAMTGDVSGRVYAGGLVRLLLESSASRASNTLINSMQGNISTLYGNAGGIVGFLDHKGSNVYHTSLNYVCGDITRGDITTACSGICGKSDDNPNISTSINAMKGYVANTVLGEVGSATIAVTVNTQFGLTFTSDNFSTDSAVSGILTDADYFDLPYALLDGTDRNGVTYDWEFVYGNITTLDLVPRPLSIKVSFGAVGGAVAYQLTVQEAAGEDGAERIVHTVFTDLEKHINSLTPETEYTVKVYSTADGSQYDFHVQGNATTPANSADNYDVSDFRNPTGAYDVSGFDTDTRRSFYAVINDLFTTGDSVVVSVNGATKKSTFVKRGGTASVVGVEALLLPFEADAGGSQSASIILSDNSSLSLPFDDEAGTIDVGGTTYAPGESAVIDGKKITFVEV
ncbi:unnamed protein product [Pylaiella littoralis]